MWRTKQWRAFLFCPFMDPCPLVNTHNSCHILFCAKQINIVAFSRSSQYLSLWCHCNTEKENIYHFCCRHRSTEADLSASTTRDKEVCSGHKHRSNISHHQRHKVSEACGHWLTTRLHQIYNNDLYVKSTSFRYFMQIIPIIQCFANKGTSWTAGLWSNSTTTHGWAWTSWRWCLFQSEFLKN